MGRYLVCNNAFAARVQGATYQGAITISNQYPIGPNWGRSETPDIPSRPGLFDSVHINGPMPLLIDDKIYVYYTGFDGVARRGGFAVYDRETLELLERPTTSFLPLGAGGASDSFGHFRVRAYPNPDPTASPDQKYVMTYGGAPNAGGGLPFYQIHFAFSPDGRNWTKYGGNPVIPLGASGAWDERSVSNTSNIHFVDGVFHIWYGAYNNNITYYWGSIGHATAPAITGPWTKQGEIFTRNTAVHQAATSTAGDTKVYVADPTAYSVGHCCVLSSGALTEFARVSGHGVGYVTVASALKYSHSNNAITGGLVGFDGGKMDILQVEYHIDRWLMWVTPYGFLPEPVMLEATGVMEAMSIDGPWSFRHDLSPVLTFDPSTDLYDGTSQENTSWIYIPDASPIRSLTGQTLTTKTATGLSATIKTYANGVWQ